MTNAAAAPDITKESPAAAVDDVVRVARRRSRSESRRTSRNATRALSVLLVVGVWQAVGTSIPYAISYPSEIARVALSTTTGTILPAFGTTFATFGVGFAICIAVGVPIGLLMARVKLIQLILDPYVTMIYSTAWIAFLPLLILLFGVDIELQVVVLLLTGIFPIIINTYLGAIRVDKALLEVGAVYNASRFKTLSTIVIPGSLHYIFAGIRIGFARALMGIIIVEIEASTLGIGYLINSDSHELRIGAAFAAIIYLGIAAILCNWVIGAADRWMTMPWTRAGIIWRLIERFTSRQTIQNPLSVGGVQPAQGNIPERLTGPARPSRLHASQRSLKRAKRRRARRRYQFLYGRVGMWVVSAVTLAAVLVAWQIYASHQSTAVLPEPTAVGVAVYQELFVTGALWAPFGSTMALMAMSFGTALVIGIPLGVLMGRSRTIESLLDPYVNFLYALPHVAFIPVLVVWFGVGTEFALAFTVFSAVFIVVINTMVGVKATDRELIATGRSFCATERQLLRTVVLPNAGPYIVAGARLAFAAAWIGVITAEMLTTETGFGGLIITDGNFFHMPQMGAAIVAIMAVSLLILAMTTRVERFLTPWARPIKERTQRG